MSLPFFSADDVTSAVSMQEAIDAMEVAFSSVNNNTAESPLRITMPIGDHDAHHLSMPAYIHGGKYLTCLLYTSPSPRDVEESRMPSSA